MNRTQATTAAAAESSATRQADSGQKLLREDIEALRVLGAIGVVWFHLHLPGSEFGYAGLVFFIALSAYLSTGSSTAWSPGFVWNRTRRIMLPWVFWFAVFGAVNVARGYPVLPATGWTLAGVLSGPNVHLWYLPFIMGVSLLSPWLAARLRHPNWILAVWALTSIGLLTAPAWREPSRSMGYPYAQYLHALPAVGIGWLLQGLTTTKLRWRLLAAASAFLCLLPSWRDAELSVSYAVGLAMMGVLLFPSIRLRFGRMAAFAKYTFGIYLVHPLCIPLCRRLGLDGQWVSVPLVFLLSLAFVALVYRIAPRLAPRLM